MRSKWLYVVDRFLIVTKNTTGETSKQKVCVFLKFISFYAVISKLLILQLYICTAYKKRKH